VRRFDPTREKTPRYVEYEVPYVKGMKVLDAVRYIQRNLDGTLAYRWNCREGICGSCAMEVDGKPVLTCKTEVRGKMLIEPMLSFPCVKDLVADVREVREKLAKLSPWLAPRPEEDAKKEFWRIKEHELHEAEEARLCIECYICYDVCHVIRNHKELPFPGPVNIVHAVGLDRHPKDSMDRSLFMHKDIWNCNMNRCCSSSCPQGIRITENFITYAKERIVEENNIVNALIRRVRNKPGPLDSWGERK